MKSTKAAPRVVIVGSGFAGIEIVKTLLKRHTTVDIIVVNKSDHFEYYPALYKLVTGAMPIEVSVPLTTIFPAGRITLVEGTFSGLDQNRQIITVDSGVTSQDITYDFLVLAMGSETNFFNIKGLPELSYSFKSVEAALQLKRHFCELFSEAARLPTEKMVAMLHVLIVGAGPSGVELAGDLRHYLSRVASEHSVDPGLITIDLIEAAPRVLPTLSARISAIAEARLRRMGINIFINRALASQEVEEVILKDMSMNSQTVIWTAGTRINAAFTKIPGVTLDERRRIVVSSTLSLPQDNHIFIAGDGAATPYSGLAQTAIEHGAYIGRHIDRITRGKVAKDYVPKRPSFVIPIGTKWAIFNHGDLVVTGFLPWVLRSAIDIRYFLGILPLRHVVRAFRKGKKYRKINGGCALEKMKNNY